MDLKNISAQSANELRLHILTKSVKAAGVWIVCQTLDLNHYWAENLPESLQKKWQIDCKDSDIFPIEIAKSLTDIKKQVLKTGAIQTFETYLNVNEKISLCYKFTIECLLDENATIIGLITTGVDITQLRQREDILKTLLREVSHRSKNLLAIIQSIASQTARYSGTIEAFLQKFQGRIQSLSRSQDIVTDSEWRGAHLQELILSQTHNFINNHDSRFIITGDNPYLFPSAALNIGLAFHELIANSLSYGALSQPSGQVNVIIELQKQPMDQTQLQIIWHETFTPKLNLTAQRNTYFGSAVLEKIVPISVNGTASYELTDTDLIYKLLLPEIHFDILSF